VPTAILTPTVLSSNSGNITTTVGSIVWALDGLDAGATVELIWRGTIDPNTPSGQTEIHHEATLLTAGGLSAKAKAISTLIP
jgi:hypothetical protein